MFAMRKYVAGANYFFLSIMAGIIDMNREAIAETILMDIRIMVIR